MVFLTGCNGLVGSFVARKFLEHNCRIRALCRKESSLGLLRDVAHKIEWVEGDVTDVKILEKAMKGAETVIHSAAIVSYAPSDKRKMFQVNIGGTANVVNAALSHDVKKFIHVSSVAALGRKKGVSLVTEDTYWENSSYHTNYASSKHYSELEVWRGMEEGMNGFIVNPSVVLGPGNWENGSTKIFKYVWDQNPFYTSGEMNLIDVRDVAEIIWKLNGEERANRQRFILNAAKMTYKDVFFKIADAFGKKRPSLEAGPVLSALAWRLEAAKAFITGSKPLITKETATLSKNSFEYDNSKITKLLNYEFIPPDATLKWVCRELANKYGV